MSGKARIVAESFAPGGTPRLTARRHGVARPALAEWRALAREGRLGPVPQAAAPAAGTLPAGADAPMAPPATVPTAVAAPKTGNSDRHAKSSSA
ncbi:MAG: transposase [Boseongicola sp. SB0677_bin_26]|nr:transposase [Boseongicola sp. SB0665_bin_10]MYG24806.1 transposase [Boseongicola sp. SB0677_bin_26]